MSQNLRAPMFQKTIQDPYEYAAQKAALLYFQGTGVVQLLECDNAKHTLTLEWISAHSLKDLFPAEDGRALKLTCEAIDTLHSRSRQTSFAFSDLTDWCAVLQRHPGLPTELRTLALEKAARLLTTTPRKVLLHGDLHHGNILLRDQQPIVIDPKAVWGDPLFEPARFILNPIDLISKTPNFPALIQKRIAYFSQHFQDEAHRIADWTFVCAVIAACWNIDDGYEAEPWLELAEVLLKLT